MIDQSTLDTIADWATTKNAGSAPSLATAASAPAVLGTPTAVAKPEAPTGMLGAAPAISSTLDTTPVNSAASTPGSPTTPASTTSNWATATAAPATAAATPASVLSTPTTTPASTSTPASSTSAAPNVDVNSWYRNELGRDGDQAGIDYWNGVIKNGMDPQAAYAMFSSSAKTNQENVKPTDWAAANSYAGPQSSDTSTPVDDWGRNVLGRELTADEKTLWNDRFNQTGATGGPAAVQALYQQFLQANAGQVKNQLSLAGASQINAGTTPATGTTPANVDVNAWYRSVLGRDGDAAGIAYWQDQIKKGMDPQQAYAMFENSAKANQEAVKPTDWQNANSYTGPASKNTTTPVDDWGRNVLGRELSPGELTMWNTRFNQAGASGGPEAAQKVYQDFLKAYDGQVKNQMTLAEASQIAAGFNTSPGLPTGSTLIDPGALAHRSIDQGTETVNGQLQKILAADGPLMQQARAQAMMSANERGMLNSAMAASGGEDAAIRSALQIATPDAAAYQHANDYNTAAENQATMFNATTQNDVFKQQQQIAADTAAQAKTLGQQMTLAQMQDAVTRYQTDTGAATSKYSADASAAASKYGTDAASANSKYGADSTAANSKYATDAQYRQQVENNKKTLVNNIIGNMELSPDRKAAMLEQLGEGTSAKHNPDGSTTPGTGLAGAVYVIDSVTPDLQYNGGVPYP